MAESFSRVHDILCCRLLFYLVTSTKDTASHCIEKVSFGQPARRRIRQKKSSRHTGNHSKPQTLVFRVFFFFSSSIMELQKKVQPCKTHPETSWSEAAASPTDQWTLWITGIFGFGFFFSFWGGWTDKIKTFSWRHVGFALISERAARPADGRDTFMRNGARLRNDCCRDGRGGGIDLNPPCHDPLCFQPPTSCGVELSSQLISS